MPLTFGNVLIAGALLMMGLYHLVISGLRGRDGASLSLAVYCLLRAFYSLCSDHDAQGLSLLLPWIQPGPAFSICMIGLILSLPLLQGFFRAVFPRQFPRWGLWGLSGAAVVCIAEGVLFHPGGEPLKGQLLYLTVVMVYTLVNLTRAWRAGEPGGGPLLVGYGLLSLCGVNDVLLGVWNLPGVMLSPAGTLAFVLAQSGLLAHRFSQAFAAVERLSVRLEAQNARLEQEILRTHQLQQKLDTISEDERRFVSRALHDGLCQDLTAARLRCSLLASAVRETGGEDGFHKISELLGNAVDQAYELSRGLWPMGQDIVDLPDALRELAERLTAEHGLSVSVRCEGGTMALSETTRERVFQIAREALTNVVKHAKAGHAVVDLTVEGASGLRLVVEDDGIGAMAGSPGKGGLGTKIMAHNARSLGGRLILAPRPDGGTRLELAVPAALSSEG
ncbi:MAG: hypothetical protein F8N37_02050 [Telmatospirillum sp.]|nr:hypothetical protein [Telmatospirillum sp.]